MQALDGEAGWPTRGVCSDQWLCSHTWHPLAVGLLFLQLICFHPLLPPPDTLILCLNPMLWPLWRGRVPKPCWALAPAVTAVRAQTHLSLLSPQPWDRGCSSNVGPHLNQRPGKAVHWPAPAAWPTQLREEEKMLGQQQQQKTGLPAKDSLDTFASHASQVCLGGEG